MDNALLDVIESRCDSSLDKVAITSVDHHFKYRDLLQINHEITSALLNLDVPRYTYIACAFPRRPLGAILCLSVNEYWAAMPLPTSLQHDSVFDILHLVSVSVLLIEESQTQVFNIATKIGFPIVIVNNLGRVIGKYPGKLGTESRKFEKHKGYALLIPTSDSTRHPKYVPLSSHNVLSAAKGIISWFNLTKNDRCFNMMPSYHVHELISATYATLLSNGTVINNDRLTPNEAINEINEKQPTWWTGVPTLYESIISAHETGTKIDENAIKSVRFIRVSSAPLTTSLFGRQRKNKFSSPVIHSYGLTETTSLICSLPLNMPDDKTTSVGVPVSSEIKIINKNNYTVQPGEKGEIIIKGDSVMEGYLDIGSSDIQQPFLHNSRWFCTGDEEYFDHDGFLHITGRFKTIIRRGGHNVSPAEIDGIVNGLEDVVSCLALSVPHPTLGEDIVCLYTKKTYTASNEAVVDSLLRLQLFDKLEG
ncbi:AMP-binding protein [Candidatus Symbiopectobacterium sp. 'North America']|uniref:AMP-binding protein n=1 Tax=Candidatus Symbiopectobacterium sp. 'North America' TaxID=2794574 RepID=UPI0018CBC008|nr:AMP-binding protein [Candidatus Symbiopectobacterium sp. 'North America']